MAINKRTAVANVDNSDLVNFPNGRIKDNTGVGDGTPVNRLVYSDIHEVFAKLMRLAAISYNDLPDSEGNGYQLVEALIALAGKNDLIATLNTSGGVLQLSGVKLSTLQPNEALICKAAAAYIAETTIAGSESGVTKTVTVASHYKTNDYVRLIKTSSGGVTLVRLADALNLNVLIGELNYLKAATNLEEITGSISTKATTPASNLTAFEDRVNGDSSDTFVATDSQNGLMSAADKTRLDSLANPVKNVGWFSGVDIGAGTIGTFSPVSGDIVTAVLTDKAGGTAGGESIYTITMANAMANTNYFVRSLIQSEGSLYLDNDTGYPVFKPISTTSFQWSISEVRLSAQSLKIHLEVVQLS